MKCGAHTGRGGDFLLVLHAHLPYVRHPECTQHLEETWLYEAILESYLPLLRMLSDLLHDGTEFRLTLSVSPTLLEMLRDELLRERFLRYVDQRIDLAEQEMFRTRREPALSGLAAYYHANFQEARQYYVEGCSGDLVAAFAAVGRSEKVELITTAATHAFLPLHISDTGTVRSQIRIGADHCQTSFGRRPSGMWLPECGYAPGLDRRLAEEGILYTFLEAHGILNGRPSPSHSIYRPVRTPEGIVCFPRDPESSRQVWSATEGYPGDPDYRDFYRDIGFELDPAYLQPYLPGITRTFTGLKYCRVTGPTTAKEPYVPDHALNRARQHAEHFLRARDAQMRLLAGTLGQRPVVTAAYDAELFGHWWHEGPAWLRTVLTDAASKAPEIRFTTPSEFLADHPSLETLNPAASSWGRNGFNAVWLDPANSWIYRHLKKASSMLGRLCRHHADADGLERRALNQAFRELLLAQASDWPFMMKTGNAAGFAETTFRDHLESVLALCASVSAGTVEGHYLAGREQRHPLFPDIDFRTCCAD